MQMLLPVLLDGSLRCSGVQVGKRRGTDRASSIAGPEHRIGPSNPLAGEGRTAACGTGGGHRDRYRLHIAGQCAEQLRAGIADRDMDSCWVVVHVAVEDLGAKE